jgi:hypothetical protein
MTERGRHDLGHVGMRYALINNVITQEDGGTMNIHWLLVGTLTMVVVAVEGTHLMRNAHRKRRAMALRARAMAAQGCQGDGQEIASEEDQDSNSSCMESYTIHRV